MNTFKFEIGAVLKRLYHMAVVRNGWYAGEVHGVVGGVIVGENTEDELIAALKAATASERISDAEHTAEAVAGRQPRP